MRLLVLEPRSGLAPLDPRDPEVRATRPEEGPQPLTGGGFVALVDPVRGVVGLWRGRERVAGPLSIELAGGPLREPGTPDGLLMGPGVWERRVALPGGGRLVERGLLADLEAGPVVEWRPDPAAPPEGALLLRTRLGPADPGAPGPAPEVELQLPGDGAARVALLPRDADPGRARRLLASLEARASERRGRGRSPGEPEPDAEARTVSGAFAAPSLGLALRVLDDAPLALDASGLPAAPFLAGVGTDAGVRGGPRPLLLEGGALAEAGLGALLAGRHALARALLAEAAAEPAVPPVPLILLAARQGLWTGRPDELLAFEGVLAAAVDRALAAPDEERTAAFPSATDVVRLLLRALEPLGLPAWGHDLRTRIEAAGTGAGTGGRRVALPVLGGAAAPAPDPGSGPSPRPVLPSPAAFAPPGGHAVARRRTLHAARLVRAWVEGVFGADAEAAWGRLTLAPRIGAGWSPLELRHLRVGDARVSLDCRYEGRTHSFLLRQESGRVPLNLVFRPRLPIAGVEEVRIGDELADVAIEAFHGGLEVRCQFPLDPNRRITIVGSN